MKFKIPKKVGMLFTTLPAKKWPRRGSGNAVFSFLVSGVSAAAGYTKIRSDRKKKLMNVEHRTFNIEHRTNEFCPS
jgi:hypothetical protein